MAAAASESEATEGELEVIRFILSGHDYAIRVGDGNSIIEPKPTTRVPRSADSVDGVMDYRGEVAVIVDLRTIFGIEESGDAGDRYDDRIIILDDSVDNQTVGFRAEQVVGVEAFSTDDLKESVKQVDSETSAVNEALLEGFFMRSDDESEGDVVELVDVEAVLAEVREASRMKFQQTK